MVILTDPSLSADPAMYEDPHDQTEDLQSLTFDDLLSFSFQVAKGMEFLSSKNVRNEGRNSLHLNAKFYGHYKT